MLDKEKAATAFSEREQSYYGPNFGLQGTPTSDMDYKIQLPYYILQKVSTKSSSSESGSVQKSTDLPKMQRAVFILTGG